MDALPRTRWHSCVPLRTDTSLRVPTARLYYQGPDDIPVCLCELDGPGDLPSLITSFHSCVRCTHLSFSHYWNPPGCTAHPLPLTHTHTPSGRARGRLWRSCWVDFASIFVFCVTHSLWQNFLPHCYLTFFGTLFFRPLLCDRISLNCLTIDVWQKFLHCCY